MAEQADGSIIIDTEIDTEGFKTGSNKIQKAISSMRTTFKNLGPTFQKALSGSASAVSSFDAKATVLESTISEIETQMQNLGNTKIPTDDYKEICAEVNKAEQALFKLYERRDKLEAVGTNKDSKAWKAIQYDIKLASAELARYERNKKNMETSGSAYQRGTNTAQYKELSIALATAKGKLADMKSKVEEASKSTRKLASEGGLLKKAFNKLGKSAKNSGSAVGKLSSKFKGLTRMLKQMLMFRVFTSIMTAVTDGFKNLALYSTQTNKDMSALKSSLTQLKNSFATAFAPILTVVTPALTKLIGYLSTAITYVGKFIAAMTGAKTFTQAKAVQEDYAASLGETGKAAKNAQKQLAGFDELNVLSKDSSDSGSSAGSVDPSEMFEEVPIESSITDFVSRIKDAFKNGDYASIGNIIAQGFNAAIDKLHSVFTDYDWPGLVAGLMQGLNGFVRGFDWTKLGTTLSTGMRTAIATLRSAITTFDWAALGKGVADGINSIDWVGILSDLAGGISDVLKGALDLLIGFAENLDWAKLGSDLWNSLIGIITNIDWSGIIAKAFQLLGAALAGAVSLIVGFAKSLWESLKSAFESTKNYFSKYIDEAGGNVILGLLNGIWNGIKNIGKWIVDNIFTPFINGFKNAFGIHSPSTVMSEMGGFLIQGLLQGIQNLWSSITTFFTNALSSLKNTITSAWEGIKSGVTSACSAIGSAVSSAWNGIKSGATSAWSSVKSTVTNAWNGIKSTVSSAASSVKSAVSTAWNNIKSTTSTVCSNVKSTVSSAWNSIKSSVSSTMNNIKSTASTAWNNVKSTVSSVCSNIKSTVSSSWNSAKTSISNAISTIKTNVSTTFSNLKSSASTWGKDVCQNMANGISKAKSTVESAVKGVADKIKSFLGFSEPEDGPLSNFHTYMPDMLDLMAKGIRDNEGVAISAVSDLAGAISDEVQNGESCFTIDTQTAATGEIEGFLTAFADKVTDSFANLVSRLQAIANGVTFAMPAMATGAVIPYHTVCADVGRSDNVDNGNSDILEELQALKEKLDNVVEAIENKETGITDAEIYNSVKKSVRTEEKSTGRSPF